MTMLKYLYPIFQTSEKNECNDLTVALAMFLSDARMGHQKYGPDGLDYAQLQADSEYLHEEARELRLFIGRHYNALVDAYATKDPKAFEEAVTACVTEDMAQEEEEAE